MASLKQGIGLGLIFVTAFVIFMVVLLPANMVTAHWPTPADNEVGMPAPQLQGLWWKGQGKFSFQDRPLSLAWELDWHGLVPGLTLNIQSGEIRANGWVGADWGNWRLEQWRGTLPTEMLNGLFPQGHASGELDIRLQRLRLENTEITAAKGNLHYGGGKVSLGQGMEVDVPALDGTLSMEQGAPLLAVTGPNQQHLAAARLQDETLTLEVFRAFPLLLKMSEGGDATDVVFSTRQNLPVSAGQAG